MSTSTIHAINELEISAFVAEDGNIILDFGTSALLLTAEQAGDLYVSGSATLVRAMLADGLVDELHLYVYPIAVGTGLRLFPDGTPRTPLRLLRQDALSNGVAHLVYGSA